MGEYVNPAKIFGENVFNDTVMQERLPKNVYKKLKKIIEEGGELDLATADTIAHEMKEDASGSPLISSLPEKLISTLPFGIGAVIKESCFSAVVPVSGWNQCV